MRVLAVLVILFDVSLDNPAAERVAVGTTAAVGDGHVLPAHGVGEFDICELDEVVVPGAGVPNDVGGRVGFVEVVVDVESDGPNLDAAEEVDGQEVGLLAVGSKTKR